MTLADAALLGQAPDTDLSAVTTGCCIRMQPTDQTPSAFGVLSLLVPATGLQQFVAVVEGLPSPQSFGAQYTRYVLWIYGGGSLRFGMALGPAAADLGTVYAGGTNALSAGPLSEAAVSAEPATSASLIGPIVLLGSFGLCR